MNRTIWLYYLQIYTISPQIVKALFPKMVAA